MVIALYIGIRKKQLPTKGEKKMGKQESGGLVERNITLRTAVLMMYCLVAAGAFGIEGMISDSGPGMTIVILCILPFV